jgi:hypothetical protein
LGPSAAACFVLIQTVTLQRIAAKLHPDANLSYLVTTVGICVEPRTPSPEWTNLAPPADGAAG